MDLASVTARWEPDGVVRLSVNGELDMSNAHLLHEAARAALATGPLTTLLLDCHALTFLDAAGISAMVRLAGELRSGGGTLSVVGAAGMVAEVLRIAGVADDLIGPLDGGAADLGVRARSLAGDRPGRGHGRPVPGTRARFEHHGADDGSAP
jgi:anti-anti-sigma factor